MKDRFEIKMNSLENHLELLDMLQSRHGTWANENLNTEIQHVHTEIIDLLGQTIKKYVILLSLYRVDND